jgi:DNA (cytosine-5)-methyltransferase 1
MYNWKWYLSELKQDKDVTVFSCFSCGGGSTMGYKRAGFKVLGNVEIDPRVNEVYKINNHPKYNYLMDLRDFNKLENLPDELYHLDILDGSPPCSTFSTAGLREKVWGKEKSFREGQKKQVLDDLFFVFLDTVEKLKPKIVVAENVTGIIKGNAKGYVNLILKRFKELGYAVQIFQLNAAYMDVPQARERVFFIANRMGYPKLKLNFHNEIIRFGKVRTAHGKSIEKSPKLLHLVKIAKQSGDTCLGNTTEKLGKREFFNYMLCYDRSVAYCLTASCTLLRAVDNSAFSDGDCINISTFPQDYNFINQDVRYVCGMSVPPNMMANIASEIYKQWLK